MKKNRVFFFFLAYLAVCLLAYHHRFSIIGRLKGFSEITSLTTSETITRNLLISPEKLPAGTTSLVYQVWDGLPDISLFRMDRILLFFNIILWILCFMSLLMYVILFREVKGINICSLISFFFCASVIPEVLERTVHDRNLYLSLITAFSVLFLLLLKSLVAILKNYPAKLRPVAAIPLSVNALLAAAFVFTITQSNQATLIMEQSYTLRGDTTVIAPLPRVNGTYHLLFRFYSHLLPSGWCIQEVPLTNDLLLSCPLFENPFLGEGDHARPLLKLENTSDSNLALEIVVSGEGLRVSPQRSEIYVPAGFSREIPLQINPERAGNLSLNISAGRRRIKWPIYSSSGDHDEKSVLENDLIEADACWERIGRTRQLILELKNKGSFKQIFSVLVPALPGIVPYDESSAAGSSFFTQETIEVFPRRKKLVLFTFYENMSGEYSGRKLTLFYQSDESGTFAASSLDIPAYSINEEISDISL
ncbi:MAG: hypothetical protein PHQ23_02925 [Candidatus Wallbacteria bacterium]|nr:hypothetical protein [Candidatus Wallbacteria bacterium]